MEKVYFVVILAPTSRKWILPCAVVYGLLEFVLAVLSWLLQDPTYTASPLAEQFSRIVTLAAVSVASIPEL